jgi:hypothetical protein
MGLVMDMNILWVYLLDQILHFKMFQQRLCHSLITQHTRSEFCRLTGLHKMWPLGNQLLQVELVTYKVRYFNFLNLAILTITWVLMWKSFKIYHESVEECSLQIAFLLHHWRWKHNFVFYTEPARDTVTVRLISFCRKNNTLLLPWSRICIVIIFHLYYVLESRSNNSMLFEIRANIAFVILLPISWIMFPFVGSLIFVSYLNKFLGMFFSGVLWWFSCWLQRQI